MAEEIEKMLNNEEFIKEAAKDAFNKFDKDKSGELDVNELEEVMKDFSNDVKIDPPTKKDVQDVLKMIDTNKSGKIDLNEFCQFIKLILKVALEAMKQAK